MNTGTIAKLWRYPVKSMLGEECPQIDLDARGLVGDRVHALYDADGRFGSGKNSRRFRQIDGMFSFQARQRDDGMEITFPDGRTMRGDDAHLDPALPETLGIAVTLKREHYIPHFDDGAVHLVTAESLDWLHARLPDSRIDERRFRPNVVVSMLQFGVYAEAVQGGSVATGDTVNLE